MAVIVGEYTAWIRVCVGALLVYVFAAKPLCCGLSVCVRVWFCPLYCHWEQFVVTVVHQVFVATPFVFFMLI